MSRLIDAVFGWGREVWIALSFVPISWLFIWALWRADRGDASTFKFVHFVTTDTGRGSYYALGYTTMVIVYVWGLWANLVLDRLTEWYLTIGASVFILGALGSTAARVIGRVKGAEDPDPAAGDAPDAPPPHQNKSKK